MRRTYGAGHEVLRDRVGPFVIRTVAPRAGEFSEDRVL